MSGKIDYDELDRAVSRATRSSQAKAKSTATRTSSSDFIAQKQSYAPRTRYMDFISRPRKKTPVKSPETKPVQVHTKQAPDAIQPQAPRRVARFAPASAGMPNYRVASSHPATKAHSIPTAPVTQPAPMPAVKPVAHITKPVMKAPTPKAPAQPITKVPAQPVAKPVARVAATRPVAKPAQAESERIQAKNTAAAAEVAAKALEKAPSSPNANNYSLGVRSPFIRNDAKVEKRPLGASSEFVQDDKVGKNTYENKTHKDNSVKDKKATKVARSKDKKSNGWIWPLIIVLIIAAGGGLGYLAYRVLENAF